MDFFTLQRLREQEEQQAQTSDQSQQTPQPPVHETKLVNTEIHDNHGMVVSGGSNTITVIFRDGKIQEAKTEQGQPVAHAEPVEDVDVLFRYIHPSVTDDAERLKIHKEIKNAVTQLSLPDLCRYLMNMEKSRGVIYLSKIKPKPAFAELHRMGLPDVNNDGYTYSNFIKHYNVNK